MYENMGSENEDVVDGSCISNPTQNGFVKPACAPVAKSEALREVSTKLPKYRRNIGPVVPNTMKLIAKELSSDIIYRLCQPNNKRKAPNRYAETLRRTVNEMVRKHEIVFNSMVEKLQLEPDNIEGIYYNVADEMSSDGQINWGRIVSLYTLGAILSRHITQNIGFDKDFLDEAADIVATYVCDKHGRWISDQGGWVSSFLCNILITNTVTMFVSASCTLYSLRILLCCSTIASSISFK